VVKDLGAHDEVLARAANLPIAPGAYEAAVRMYPGEAIEVPPRYSPVPAYRRFLETKGSETTPKTHSFLMGLAASQLASRRNTTTRIGPKWAKKR
jgi:hypothetical protein